MAGLYPAVFPLLALWYVNRPVDDFTRNHTVAGCVHCVFVRVQQVNTTDQCVHAHKRQTLVW